MVIEQLGKILNLTDALKTVRPKSPRHIAISLEGEDADIEYAAKNNISLDQLYEKKNKIIEQLLVLQVRLNIPIITLLLMSNKKKNLEQYPAIIDSLMKTFDGLAVNNEIQKQQVKISVLGKWYALPGRLVESIKKAIDETRENEKFYFNLCVNYGGPAELVDACRLIARSVKAEKFDAETVNETTIKENIYTSYFMPPELVIINGPRKLSGFLLWDSSEAAIHFTGKPWPELKKVDVVRAIGEM